jgi:hypothetical protein
MVRLETARLRAAVELGAQLFLLNALITGFRWFPTYDFHLLLAPAPETAIGFLVLAVGSRVAPRLRRWLMGLLAVTAAAYFLFGLGEAFYQHVYRRAFVPWTDLSLAPAFFEMVLGREVISTPFAAAAAVATTLALVSVVFVMLLARIDRCSARLGTGGVTAAAFVMAGLMAVYGTGLPLTPRIAAQLRPQDGIPSDTTVAAAERPAPTGSRSGAAARADESARFALPGIADADLHLLIVESYGRTVFENPHHRRRLEATYEQTERMLGDAGYAMASHYLVATTFGGTSWLSDATLLTGARIDTQQKYESILHTDRFTLLDFMENAGYHTVMSAPGTDFATEEWAAFYHFDRYIFHDDFGYEGRYFQFGVMPDQYQLDFVRQEVLDSTPGDRPAFILYMLVSSHVPWNYIPPYLEDWDRIDDGSIYDGTDNTYYENSWVAGSEYFEGYTHSVRYVLEVIRGYLTRYVSGGDLVIITGDHQPKFPISGRDASFAVPVHVLSRNERAVAAFRRFGYRPGLIPDQDPPHPGMEEFFPQLRSVTGAAP